MVALIDAHHVARGWIHLLSNVLIQLRVGGYLNLVFTTPKWAVIYLLSGIFGNVCSCLLLPDSVSVGSSGAVLGILTAWLVWIVYRWKKVPHEAKGQRNCQLGVVTLAVVVTLAFSFSPFVDYGAHFGGALMGLLLATILLAGELEKCAESTHCKSYGHSNSMLPMEHKHLLLEHS